MLRVTEATEKEITITEHYAVEIYKTGRGMMAEVVDFGSPYHGLYALGSTKECALAALMLKVSRAASGECY